MDDKVITNLILFNGSSPVDRDKPIIIKRVKVKDFKEKYIHIYIPLVYPNIYVKTYSFATFDTIDEFTECKITHSLDYHHSPRIVLIPEDELDSFITDMMIDIYGITTFIQKEQLVAPITGESL